MSTSSPWKLPVAWAVAYLLVMQMVLAGFALGAQAGQARGQATGILCAASGSSDSGGGDSPPASHVDCCVSGCPMAGALWIPAPGQASVPAPQFIAARKAPPPAAEGLEPARREDPQSARGPPRAG
ncbi:hypothetical protein [Xanthobacter sp. KR7-225]|uniref:hypothetical protein n=1 Tax=Xanthobacter sp. KR7-225 TaxID=3156613 RepID=UPI0032B415CC